MSENYIFDREKENLNHTFFFEDGDEEEEIQDKGEIVSTEPAPIENADPAME